jgi:hypothetical protein
MDEYLDEEVEIVKVALDKICSKWEQKVYKHFLSLQSSLTRLSSSVLTAHYRVSVQRALQMNPHASSAHQIPQR